MNSDPVCLTEATDTETEYYVVGDGDVLANVFVYVKEGLEGRTSDTERRLAHVFLEPEHADAPPSTVEP